MRIIIPKELLNSKSDQELYLFSNVVCTKKLIYLFEFKSYFVYHKKYEFDLVPHLDKVKQYISIKVN